MNRRIGRIQRDVEQLTMDPLPNIAVWPEHEQNIEELSARVTGPCSSPFSGGSFYLSIKFPERYPFEPPHVTFKTKIHHPNIDSQGRICLELLKMPPQGVWKPHLNLASVLSSIYMLMAEPNPNDPLDPEIAEEFKSNRALFEQKARMLTQKYATDTPSEIRIDNTMKKSEEMTPVVLPCDENEDKFGIKIEYATASKTEATSQVVKEDTTEPAVQKQQAVKNPVPPSERPFEALLATQQPAKRNPFAVLGKKPKPS